jgi:uncharacterized protein involved in outer membrane biogenesis
MRILLYGVLGLLVLAVGGALVAPSLIDWNPFKRDLALEVKAATGREVEIAGNLDLALLPSPHLVADGVRLANAPGAAVPDMARIKSLRVDVRFWPLLAGRIEVKTLRLVQPAIELERLANGRVNWDFSSPPTIGRPERETGMALDIGRLIVEGGTVTWRDTPARQVERAEKVDAEVTATSLSGPFRVNGRLVARGAAASVEANIGQIGANAPVPVSLHVALGGLGLEFAGALAETNGTPRLDGKLKGGAESFARALDLAAAPKALAAKLSFAGDLTATQKRAALSGIEIELGDQRGRGAAEIAFGDVPRVKASLDIARLTLAPWLDSPGSSGKGQFALPANVAGAFELSVQLVEAKGGPFRDVKIAAALDQGGLRVDRAAALLPGGTNVTLGGLVAAKDGKAEFDLALEADSAHLRGLLDALGVDVARVAPDRLLTASASAKLKGDADKFDVLGIEARFDGAKLTGGVTVAAGTRTGIGASLALDRLDLDAYLAGAGNGGKGQKSSTKFWKSFDANLRASIARVDWRSTRLDGAKLDLTLHGGALALREAAAQTPDGPLKLVGAMADVETSRLTLERIEATFQGVPLTGAGALDFAGERPKLVAKLAAGDIVLKPDDTAPTGVWSRETIDFAALRTLDADVTVDAESVSWRSWAVKGAHGVATLKDGGLDVPEITGKLFGGAFKGSGRLEPGEQPTFVAKLRVEDGAIEGALFSTRAEGLDITGGVLSLSTDLAARGESPFAIVSTLQGTAELTVRDGTVRGFDLPAVSDKLRRVNDPFDLVMLGPMFSAGESKFASLRGTFKVEAGAVRTEDLTLVAPSGAGSAGAVADLPRWTLDSQAEFILTELKDSPPVIVKFDGRLDDPSATVDSEALRQWVIRRGLGQKEKEKPTPVAAAPKPEPKSPLPPTEPKPEAKPAEEPPPTEQAAQPQPPDGKALTKGLLEGLRP